MSSSSPSSFNLFCSKSKTGKKRNNLNGAMISDDNNDESVKSKYDTDEQDQTQRKTKPDKKSKKHRSLIPKCFQKLFAVESENKTRMKFINSSTTVRHFSNDLKQNTMPSQSNNRSNEINNMKLYQSESDLNSHLALSNHKRKKTQSTSQLLNPIKIIRKQLDASASNQQLNSLNNSQELTQKKTFYFNKLECESNRKRQRPISNLETRNEAFESSASIHSAFDVYSTSSLTNSFSLRHKPKKKVASKEFLLKLFREKLAPFRKFSPLSTIVLSKLKTNIFFKMFVKEQILKKKFVFFQRLFLIRRNGFR